MKKSTINKPYKIIKIIGNYENRYIVVDPENNDVILDDAQGYGYITEQNAYKAAWWKFENGKNKSESEVVEIKSFFKKNPEIKKYLADLIEINFKEIGTRKTKIADIIKEVNNKYSVDINKKYIKHV